MDLQKKYEEISLSAERYLDEELRPKLREFEALDDPGDYLQELNLVALSTDLELALEHIANDFAAHYRTCVDEELRDHWAVGSTSELTTSEIEGLQSRLSGAFSTFFATAEQHEGIRQEWLRRLEEQPDLREFIDRTARLVSALTSVGGAIGLMGGPPGVLLGALTGLAVSVGMQFFGGENTVTLESLSEDFRKVTEQVLRAFESGVKNLEHRLHDAFQEHFISNLEKAAARQAAVEHVESFASQSVDSINQVAGDVGASFNALTEIISAVVERATETAGAATETGRSLFQQSARGGRALLDGLGDTAHGIFNWWSGDTQEKLARSRAESASRMLSADDQSTREGWKTWEFGADLRLRPAEAEIPTGSHRDENINEEAVETLLALNLDKLFPHWSLRGEELRLRDFGGADMKALDPAGRRHIFEVKHDHPCRNVVDQVMAYGLTSVRQHNLSFFDQQPLRRLAVANRIAAFWTGTRLENYSKGELKFLEPTKQWEAILERLLEQTECELTPEIASALADLHVARIEKTVIRDSWADRKAEVSDTHLHMVVPYASSINEEARAALRRMSDRNVAANIWEIAVEVAPDQLQGRLYLRPAALDDSGDVPSDERWAPDITQLVAEMARLDDSGLVQKTEWNWKPSKNQVRCDAWPETPWVQSPKLYISIDEEDGSRRVTCTLQQSWRKWVEKNPDDEKRKKWRELLHARREFSADWLLAVLDDFPNDSRDKPFTYNSSNAWHCKTREHSIPAKGRHSATHLKKCTVSVEMDELGLSTAARACNEALAAFSSFANDGPSAEFGPVDR